MKNMRLLPAFLLLLTLTACGSSGKDAPVTGKRIAVLEAVRKPATEPTVAADFTVELPEPAINTDWAQNGGNAAHAMGHLGLASTTLKKSWSADVGSGSGGYYKLLSMPVINGKMLYAQDSKGTVSAYNTANGSRYWRVETAPTNSDNDAIGGGLAYENGVLYVTTGFGEVLALRANDGAVIWRRMLGKPIRSAPTVSDGRLFVINIENETFMLDAKSSLVIWKHTGIAESATLMGSSSPAVNGDTVVVAYSSGEVFGLRAQNGRVVWSEVLAVPTKIGALPAIADIRALPVMDKGVVFSVSHSGRMVAVDERRGDRKWEADLGGVNTPVSAGNVVYLLTNDSELMAISQTDGRVVWSVALQRLEKPSDRESDAVSWSGPVLAGGRLWLTNSLGHLASFMPQTGQAAQSVDLGDSFYLPPVVADQTLYVLTDDGKLIALR
ncbi:MAG TPA: pyrrolo-quinoline quinone [Rhodospirillaceae bacterium]|nr:pyrrolo-quinoline quinone [Rhodospirillaceae bacterium]